MTITVNANAPSEIIFDLEIEGLATLSTLECRFCITHDVSMFFPCQKVGDKQFSVKLPALPMLSKGQTYNFTVEVIADNYFFKALQDTLSVADVVTKVTASINTGTTTEQPPVSTPTPTPAATKAPEPAPEPSVDAPVNTPPPKASEIPMVFKPGKASFEMEPVKVNTPLITSVSSEEKDADTLPKKDEVKKDEPKKDDEKKEPVKKEFKPFEKKKDPQTESVLTDKDKKVLEILAENEKQHQQKIQEEVSLEILQMMEKREKNKRVRQILQDHKNQRG